VDSLQHGRPLPVAIYVPALISHSRAEYFRELVPTAHRIGYRPVVLNYRGLGGNRLLTERLNCGANFDDLKCAVEHIRDQNPGARIVGIGFSMGASILGGYLIAAHEDSLVDAAFLVSTCWNFKQGSDNLNIGFLNRRFNRILTGMLLKKLAQGRQKYSHEEWFKSEQHKYNPEQIRRAQSIRDFDERFTSKMFGFANADEYYRAATMTGRVNRIRVPTLSLNAADDMIAPEKVSSVVATRLISPNLPLFPNRSTKSGSRRQRSSRNGSDSTWRPHWLHGLVSANPKAHLFTGACLRAVHECTEKHRKESTRALYYQ